MSHWAAWGPGDGTPHADRWRRVLSRFLFAPRSAEEGSGLHIPGSDGLGAGPDRESAPQPRHPHRPPAPWAYLRSRLGAVPGVRPEPGFRRRVPERAGTRGPARSGRPLLRAGAAGEGLRVPSRPACPWPAQSPGDAAADPNRQPAAQPHSASCWSVPVRLSRWEVPRRAPRSPPFQRFPALGPAPLWRGASWPRVEFKMS